MNRFAGWLAITVALLALAPSLVPGAISLFGLTLSLSAVVLSLFSVTKNGEKYFRTTGIIAIGNVLLINDALRIWEPLPMPFHIKLFLYGVVVAVLVICALLTHSLKTRPKQC